MRNHDLMVISISSIIHAETAISIDKIALFIYPWLQWVNKCKLLGLVKLIVATHHIEFPSKSESPNSYGFRHHAGDC